LDTAISAVKRKEGPQKAYTFSPFAEISRRNSAGDHRAMSKAFVIVAILPADLLAITKSF